MKKVSIILLSFALGVASGVWWTDRTSVPATDDMDAEVWSEPESPATEAATVPLPTVEVIADDSETAEPVITAAHVERQVRRQAVREKKSQERRDFLADLNRDLLTSEQLATHDLYLEAMEVRNAIREEISSLRVAGKDVPAEMQRKLADAESVLRSDRETEMRILREAAARAAGLQESDVRQLLEDINAIDKLFH